MRLGFPRCLFSSHFLTKILYIYLISSACPNKTKCILRTYDGILLTLCGVTVIPTVLYEIEHWNARREYYQQRCVSKKTVAELILEPECSAGVLEALKGVCITSTVTECQIYIRTVSKSSWPNTWYEYMHQWIIICRFMT
jgi:hypothetical protein